MHEEEIDTIGRQLAMSDLPPPDTPKAPKKVRFTDEGEKPAALVAAQPDDAGTVAPLSEVVVTSVKEPETQGDEGVVRGSPKVLGRKRPFPIPGVDSDSDDESRKKVSKGKKIPPRNVPSSGSAPMPAETSSGPLPGPSGLATVPVLFISCFDFQRRTYNISTYVFT